jgi:hypothetical protein
MKITRTIPAVLLIIVTLIPRLVSLNSFVTVDEPFWLSVGANYYYAIGQRELENTVYEYHPAVTTMSLVTAAFLVDFPDYRGLGQGYFDVDKEKFDPFLIEHGHDPLHLLYLSRLFQVALITLFALVIFYLLSVFVGAEKAFFATLLISSAPYFLGHSRILSHEAMVAFFVIASIFGMMAYLEYERKWIYLLVSAVSAALAQLTKSSAMAMFPLIGLMLLFSAFGNTDARGLRASVIVHLKVLAQWSGLLIITYFVLWPGMWVAPGKMLYEVYGNAFSYAFQGARLQVTHELQPSTFSLDAMGGMIVNFVMQILVRQTPIGWLGLILAALSLLGRGKWSVSGRIRKLTLYLFLNAVLFVLLFSAAQGRNSPHYIMAAHVSMDAIAALGWCALWTWAASQWSANVQWVFSLAGTLLVSVQLWSAFSFYPYYYTYANPVWSRITHEMLLSDYGDGFEQAAVYLAEKPGAESLAVFSYRGRGPFSYFFPGRTIILNPLFMEEPGMGSVFGRLENADYIVINDAFAVRTERTALFVQALSQIEPEKSIQLKGSFTIHIYRVADLPPSFYEIISQ